ncbi:HAD-IA family hydrolase [Palleronia caenipelagi]|uniref:HAD-IA family hydrolase n=1 Tax=Palleronia caenipelagi TaxID=2489174 RepID=A0A547Q9Y4_9RHOB|nr:HAD-IA family hydrolase [Palleronia caenipelagi]TRD23180.1 HAD-IA family hydrolase [Palleronia caenipelagi]
MKLALFDMDGTLIDSQGHIVQSLSAAFAAIDRPAPSRAEILSQVGRSLPLFMRALAPGLEPEEEEQALNAYKASYKAMRERGVPPLFEGIADVLEAIHAQDDWLWGIATGASCRGLNAIAEGHALRLATRQCADDHPSKPDPSMVYAALQETGVSAVDAVVIGDTVFDMEMAAAAGVTALGVSWGYHRPMDLLDAGAVVVAETPADILVELQRMWGSNG